MNHLKNFQLFEKTLSDAKQELKDFQEELDIETTIRDLLETIKAQEVDIDGNGLFRFLNTNKTIDELLNDSQFINELSDLRMKPSEITNTEDLSTFSKIPLKYIWLYSDDSSELENFPIYMIIQYEDISDESDNKWSDIRMFYVNKEIDSFYEALSKVTLDIKEVGGDKKWTYTTSNSGENWELENKEMVTNTFKINLEWEDIIMLSNHRSVEIVFY